MSQKKYLQIVNFDNQLHYKDKNPVWIKLYCSLLDDYEFALIADETKFHAVGLMILAGRLNNRLPDDEAWLRQKINANAEINLKLLVEIGFLAPVKEARNGGKNSFNARKSKKTNGDRSRAVSAARLAQNRTEHNKTEENRTQHNTTEQSKTDAPRETVSPDAAENCAAAVAVCEFENPSEKPKAGEVNKTAQPSEFSLDECLRYVKICEGRGETIRNPQGLATSLHKTGSADAFIRAALYPKQQAEIEKEIYGEPRKFTAEPCSVCYGSKMEIVKDRGARPCPHCKNERGSSTGLEPEGEKMDETTY